MRERKPKKYLRHIFVYILIAAVISIFMTKYVASAYKIKGNSMFPVLADKERIIINKIAVKRKNINRYDIVVLKKPDNIKKSVIKRVIGLPGELIQIMEGEVFINNKKILQPFLKKPELMNKSVNMKPLLIKKGYYFVLGDNRKISVDSRSFGVVPKNYIYGKAIFRYWPFSRFGAIE